jgi:uncharacterized metal-binding protein YceD (DUF177 family)
MVRLPEFSRPLQVDRVPCGGSYEKIMAEGAELEALASRLDVSALHRLRAELKATPWRGGGLKLEGFLRADLEQESVVSLEPFRHEVEFPITRYFMADGAKVADGEAEVDPIVNGYVDLGEVVAETLALDLDPYPRKPGESFEPPEEAGTEVPATVSPFAALDKLKPK